MEAKALYFGDNGRITCSDLKCAGMTAHYSKMKRDLSGGTMERMTPATAREFEASVGEWPKCEGCGSEATVLA